MISPSPNLPDPTVILATDRFVVIDKPSGMLSVIGKGPDKHDCAVVRVARMFPAARGGAGRANVPGRPRPDGRASA